MATAVRGRLGLSVFSDPSTGAPAPAPKPKTTAKRKTAGKKAKPAGTSAKVSKAPTGRGKRVSRRSSEGKPRSRSARETTKDDQPG
jgi:hypothetical protein